MNSLTTAYTRKQLLALVDRLQADGYVPTMGTSSIVMHKNGTKQLSAISPTGSRWSVMVSQSVAQAYNLPLWKDAK